ncbi:MAG: hypothetical protein LBG60_05065 [Bifidobacteriaceae bacterium]|jgi:hypothetical protein|nr:hypothetical protein [Bifidobacteriaceae bacterium]
MTNDSAGRSSRPTGPGAVKTAAGLAKSLGRLVGASVRASGKAMDELSERLRAYAESGPPKPPGAD